jgi:hypothetical protein
LARERFPLPLSHRARQATEPAPHASYTHATLPHAQYARVTTPWPRRSTHRVPATLTPPTVDGIRFGNTKSNHASPNCPSLAQSSISTIHVSRLTIAPSASPWASTEHKAPPHAEPQPFPSRSLPPWWHSTRTTPLGKMRRRKRGVGRSRSWAHRQEARRRSEGTLIDYIYIDARHDTTTSPHCTNSPCTTILSPPPHR